MRTTKISIYLTTALFFLVSVCTSTAQIYFKLSMTEDEKTYIVSMVPEISLSTPMNMVSTSQVTIKLPAGNNFVINNVRTDLENVQWRESYVAEGPEEAPDFEYISFGLTSLAAKTIPFEFGAEVELFRFDNMGDCPGIVSIIDNFTDPFLYPNSKSVSISNGMTVLGLGTHAYQGNVEGGTVGCISGGPLKEAGFTALQESIEVSPNPTIDALKLSYGNVENFNSQKLLIYNIDGKLLQNEVINGNEGNHSMNINVRNWKSGSYLLYIENDKGTTRGTRFVKINAF